MEKYINDLSSRLGPFLEALPHAIIIILLVCVVYFLASRTLSMLDRRQKISPLVAQFLRRLLRWIAIFVGILLVLQSFGVLANAWAAITAVLAMVAIGFVAVWSVMSNAMCSLIILLSRPFQIGDQLEFPPDPLKGTVVNFSLLFTTLKTEDGRLIQIPNNMFFQRVIIRVHGGKKIELEDQLLADKDARV
jgi:small-conductance mechanosensitive channel